MNISLFIETFPVFSQGYYYEVVCKVEGKTMAKDAILPLPIIVAQSIANDSLTPAEANQRFFNLICPHGTGIRNSFVKGISAEIKRGRPFTVTIEIGSTLSGFSLEMQTMDMCDGNGRGWRHFYISEWKGTDIKPYLKENRLVTILIVKQTPKPRRVS